MQNDKAPERIYLQYHKASERISIMWTEYPEKNKTQIDIPYIRADLVESLKANQIPGRCGECAHLIHTDTDPGYCEVAQSWWGKSEFCNRFEPKGE